MQIQFGKSSSTSEIKQFLQSVRHLPREVKRRRLDVAYAVALLAARYGYWHQDWDEQRRNAREEALRHAMESYPKTNSDDVL